MYDAMHYENHMAKERELINEVERWRERQNLRARQRKLRYGKFNTEPLWFAIREKMHQIRHTMDSAINPNRHSLGAGK